MAFQDDETIFDLGYFRLRAQQLDDSRIGMKVDVSRMMVHNITPEDITSMRDALTYFLVTQGYE